MIIALLWRRLLKQWTPLACNAMCDENKKKPVLQQAFTGEGLFCSLPGW